MFAPADLYVRQCGPGARALRRRALVVWACVAAGASLFVSLIIAAPLLLAGGQEALAGMIYRAFSRVCHQIPERSLYLAGHQLAVCSRCTGIYAGFLLGLWSYPLVRSLKRRDAPRRVWLLVSAVPLAIDWTLGVLDIWANTHFSRFSTGAFFGAVCAFFIAPGLVELSRTNWRRILLRDNKPSGLEIKPDLPERNAPSDYGSPASRI
jgi:uncharacterized membrane protein